MADKKPQTPPEPETTGHDWDGITEFDTPMPRWWLWTFYATIVWAFGYMVAYPAWPLISSATTGMLGYSSRGEVAQSLADVKAARAPLDARLVDAELASLSSDPELSNYVLSGGGAVFKTFCSQCHGAGGAGVQASGYPNLLDDDWLWGGKIDDIYTTIRHGIRWETDDDTRFSDMPAFSEFLEDPEIDNLVQFVLAFSNLESDATMAAAAANPHSLPRLLVASDFIAVLRFHGVDLCVFRCLMGRAFWRANGGPVFWPFGPATGY
jgi:cytochrome c oxidase cbb3-type subunit 3